VSVQFSLNNEKMVSVQFSLNNNGNIPLLEKHKNTIVYHFADYAFRVIPIDSSLGP
jgi:hypothetical protein